jgi:alkane 1-monooxygenase
LYLGWLYGGYWTASSFVLMTIIVSLVDFVMPEYKYNFIKDDFSEREIKLLNFMPIGYIMGYLVLLYLYILNASSLSMFELVLSVVSLGLASSINLSACHELVHKRSSSLRMAVGKIGLISNLNLQFEDAHVFGHHKNMATIYDYHYVKEGQNVYEYIIGSLKGTFNASLKHKIVSWKGNWSNKVVVSVLMVLTIILPVLSIYFVTDIYGALLFFAQAFIGIAVLEAISYIQHYGLQRSEMSGKYEKINGSHSWDHYGYASSFMTLMLQRHADHHKNSGREYYLLKTENLAPRLPFGYPTMISIVLITPLWNKVMGKFMTLEKCEVTV